MDLDIKDVDLEWSDADYQNLITFSIFARMVRPQLMAVSCHAVSFILYLDTLHAGVILHVYSVVNLQDIIYSLNFTIIYV